MHLFLLFSVGFSLSVEPDTVAVMRQRFKVRGEKQTERRGAMYV